ncbi:hypothetical protein M501DRAFT_1011807 [Patellaria atrata CBS 101060]|uniref:Uncharacterized protein n=1 Tax=Patellaria atrata CBS 101060 TaxID=1346257 RepID=A0A9P4S977_9PEZI|nr:hypothetical protein M501DRAFT_1011807 [Patellaria atrata CBS 101060]
MPLINELWEAISRDPSSIEARKLLIEHYIVIGWLEAARDVAKELLPICPDNKDVQNWILSLNKSTEDTKKIPQGLPVILVNRQLEFPNVDNLNLAQTDLREGYVDLQARAKALKNDIDSLRGILQHKKLQQTLDTFIPDLNAILEGRVSTVLRATPPKSARQVARTILDILISDLGDVVRWLRSSVCSKQNGEDIRDGLMKRVQAISAALPSDLEHYGSKALMHVEHEVLRRSYVNEETMYGDAVQDIPRSNFWVSEDGYAWDMEELAQAIRVNNGVMRQPLSKQLFTPNDVSAIVQHPLGRNLAALKLEQEKLSQGVRAKTVDEIETLAKVLLADMTETQVESRYAIDTFLVYIATLPLKEQETLNALRIPATDSHTGQAFDTSIGESIRDAKGNRTCLHKTGDLLQQASKFLRQQKLIL